MTPPPPTASNDRWTRIKAVLPYGLVVCLFGLGVWALYHLLSPVNLTDVMVQVRGTPWHILGLALIGTFFGYVSLVGYDWSALQYLGKTLPLSSIATGGFLGYALGNTIGAGPVTGGAVRYRIYSALGLTGYDIAGIAVFGSIAFGLGSTIIGFGALAVHPLALQTVLPFSPMSLRLLGYGGLLVSLSVLIALGLRRSEFRLRGHSFPSPSMGLLVGQLAFMAVDIIMAASVLFILLPPNDLGFATFVAVFAAAVLAGVASHVPGGVGVFEAVIIAALPASVPLEKVAAGLLLYRLIYFLVPFAVALVLLALTEVNLARGKLSADRLKALEPVTNVAKSIIPLAMSAMIFASGIFMLLASILPVTDQMSSEMEMLLPLGFVEGGALLSSAIGVALMVIAHGLLRRNQGAFWLATIALSVGVIAALMQGLDYERAIILIAMIIMLVPCRREFFRTSRLTQNPLSQRWVLLVIAVAGAALATYFFAHKATEFSASLWWQFAFDKSAPRATRAGLVASVLLGVLFLVLALRPPRVAQSLATETALNRAEQIVIAQDNPDANFVFTGDKSILFSESGQSFLMYRIQGRSWIALGDPIGDIKDATQLVWEFCDAASAANCRPVFYEATPAFLSLWAEMGLAIHKMGEEAVVDLTTFSLDGSERKRLRTTYNRAGRDGLSFEVLPAPIDDQTMADLKNISDQWLTSKKSKEKQFSVGRFEWDYMRRFPIAVVWLDGRIVSFANVMTTQTKKEATLDLMRYVNDAPSGLMEYMFIALILDLKDKGYQTFSLGMSPFSGLSSRRGSRWTAKLGNAVYRHGGHFYNFEGLRGFKEKFDPDWQPRFLVAPPRANILLIAKDATALISGTTSLESV